MNSSPTISPKPLEAELPGQQIRGIVSLLIIVHLLFVFLAMVTSTDSGASKLLRDIKEFTPGAERYLTQLWLDRGYDYHLMNDLPLDQDHHFEATIRLADDKLETLTLPEPSIWPSERRDRYAKLAWYVDYFVSRATATDAMEIDVFRKNLLSGSIGAGLIRQHPGSSSVALRCVYHRGISRLEMADPDAHARDPNDPRYTEQVSDVSVVLTSEGRPQTFDNLTPLEVSPLKTSTEATGSSDAKSPAAKKPAPKPKSGSAPKQLPKSN